MSRKLDPNVPPVIGRYYEVPCVYVKSAHRTAYMPTDGWVPVLGPPHADPDLGIDLQHYHIDWRFVSPRLHNMVFGSYPATQIVSSTEGRYIIGGMVMKTRQCKAPAEPFPSLGHRPMAIAFEKSFRSACLRPGHICPHRGFAVGAFASPDGTVVCPGHGLKWDLKTGQNLPHHCKEGSP